jgi:hypothetical protein
MHLVGPLCADRPSAADGYATIYRRGTTTPATTYTTFEGAGAAAPAQHTLDGYGIAVRYVNELVEVTVYDSDGVRVLGPVVAGDNATAIEVVHAHVTGIDYATGQAGLNKPSTLHREFDKRFTSFGADDWQVKVGGIARNLKDVLLTQFFDVKGPSYGAVGNGTADDTVPLQAVCAAVNAAGGGAILFSPGTYKISGTLSLTKPTLLLGLGSGRFESSGCIISQTANADIFTSTSQLCGMGLDFTYAAGKTGNWLSVTDPDFGICQFLNCIFGTPLPAAGAAGSFGGSIQLALVDCTVYGATTPALAGPSIAIKGGSFGWASSATPINWIQSAEGSQLSCAATSGTHYVNSSTGRFTGCTFSIGAAGTLYLTDPTAVSPLFIEAGCYDSSSGGGVVYCGAVPIASTLRDTTRITSTGSATTYAPNPGKAKYFEVTSSAASFEWSSPTPAPVGNARPELVLLYVNTSGGAITPTLGAAYGGTPISVANNRTGAMHFVWDGSFWVQTAAMVTYV